MERKAAQQNKNTSEELKQGLPRHSWAAQVTNCNRGLEITTGRGLINAAGVIMNKKQTRSPENTQP